MDRSEENSENHRREKGEINTEKSQGGRLAEE